MFRVNDIPFFYRIVLFSLPYSVFQVLYGVGVTACVKKIGFLAKKLKTLYITGGP
jgi:hypothetical protein